jgi:hypothetical protein
VKFGIYDLVILLQTRVMYSLTLGHHLLQVRPKNIVDGGTWRFRSESLMPSWFRLESLRPSRVRTSEAIMG